MVVHKCYKCGKTFTHVQSLKYHLYKKKKPCTPPIQNGIIKEIIPLKADHVEMKIIKPPKEPEEIEEIEEEKPLKKLKKLKKNEENEISNIVAKQTEVIKLLANKVIKLEEKDQMAKIIEIIPEEIDQMAKIIEIIPVSDVEEIEEIEEEPKDPEEENNTDCNDEHIEIDEEFNKLMDSVDFSNDKQITEFDKMINKKIEKKTQPRPKIQPMNYSTIGKYGAGFSVALGLFMLV